MAKIVGTVKQVRGEVVAVGSDGSHRELIHGSPIYAGDVLETGAWGAVAVSLTNGKEIILGRDSTVTMNDHMSIGDGSTHILYAEDQVPTQGQLTDIQRVQAAIAAGQDPTTIADPTAAGYGPGNGQPGQGGGSHSFILLTEVGGEVDPIVGFPTNGTPLGFIEPGLFIPPATPFDNIGAPDVPPIVTPTPPDLPPGNPPTTPNAPDQPVTFTGLDASPAELTVNEANLPQGTTPNNAALTQTSTFTVNAPDGLTSLTIGGIDVVSNSAVVAGAKTVVTPEGTLTIDNYDLATGVVTYTYTLTGAVTHPAGNGTNNVTESFQVVGVDSNGSKATGSLDVNVTDDIPHAVDGSSTVTTSSVDSNLLIVLDVSNSMNDPSKVNGLTRLELAKESIDTLLDKYSGMGDVRVQLVTFSSHTDTPSTIWVDVDTAKGLIAGLTAGGGTNYDYALAAAEQAYTTDGKIVGAQNLTYFFSDGNPTLSDLHPTTKDNDGNKTNTNLGDGIDPVEEAAWTQFLTDHDIKSYAIGLGPSAKVLYLNPVAYDGSTGTNMDAIAVTDLNDLNRVLDGTVQGAPVTGNLVHGTTEGSFGADGGFIKAVVVDGVVYTFNPAANNGAGGLTVSGGANAGVFDSAKNTLSVNTAQGGHLVLDFDSGDYTYTPPKNTGTDTVNEHFGYVVSDNDGDLATANLNVTVNPNTPPVAHADNIITNIFDASLSVPSELLVANDTDANGDALTARPGNFPTGWSAPGTDFTAASMQTINGTTKDQVAIGVNRNSFYNNAVAMTALVLVSGALGSTASGSDAQDVISVSLKKGETLKLDHDAATGAIGLEWKAATDGTYQAIAEGGTFTAQSDGVYQIHVTNDSASATTAENYQLSLTVGYANQAAPSDYTSTYTVTDGHGGADSAPVTIAYQDSHTLVGTSGDDILMAGAGNDTLNGGGGNDVLSGGDGNDVLHGGAGDDTLIGGAGDDILDGGDGVNTASYASATSAVHVDLAQLVAQDTLGAGKDTLSNIQNLLGSAFDDQLFGDAHNNVLNGGAGNDLLNGREGNDTLIGGLGNDTLTGGEGADTFKWQAGDSGHDTITDFTAGVDKLDLSQLLKGASPTAASLDDYLHFSVSGSGASVVSSINVSAVADGAPTQTIDLAGVDLASQYHVAAGANGVISAGVDTATVINGMLHDHSLKVDTV